MAFPLSKDMMLCSLNLSDSQIVLVQCLENMAVNLIEEYKEWGLEHLPSICEMTEFNRNECQQ